MVSNSSARYYKKNNESLQKKIRKKYKKLS